MENGQKFTAIWVQKTKKDGSTYEYLSIGVLDENEEYTEIDKVFLNPLQKKLATYAGIDLNVYKEI